MRTTDFILLSVVVVAGYAWLTARAAQASPHAAGKCGPNTVPGYWIDVL
jgi:hypothetical protein